MLVLTEEFIRDQVADSRTIFHRGEKLFENGAYCCKEANREKGSYIYEVDGSYGDYTIALQFTNGDVRYSCTCPYPGDGCKHTADRTRWSSPGRSAPPSQAQSPERLEEVMNSGLQFISGLLEMATGQKLSPLADGQSMIRVDRQTGEVTMKFKLPGF